LDRRDLTISVNLSGRQIADLGLVDDVKDVLVGSGLEPRCLILEITESILVQDSVETMATLRSLKALGVRLAIDDFGTGYSSLSYLRQFPIDLLKIDRSFVASLDGSVDSAALVRSIIELGNTLRLETIAEGIEDVEQRDQLLRLGTRRGQGYLFARPMVAAELRSQLAARPASTPSLGLSTGSSAAARRPRRMASKPHDPPITIHP
jgi:EAL domain-containing protein (putative c-di-GMP-specific phosphodiesterase class I)